MSPLRFRAWHDGKMTSFDLKDYLTIQSFINFEGELYRGLVVMQSTGLRDKNGREIFEGDVVKSNFGNAVVKWIENIAAFQMELADSSTAPLGQWYRNAYEFEVIGNIYENPDLLPQAA